MTIVFIQKHVVSLTLTHRLGLCPVSCEAPLDHAFWIFVSLSPTGWDSALSRVRVLWIMLGIVNLLLLIQFIELGATNYRKNRFMYRKKVSRWVFSSRHQCTLIHCQLTRKRISSWNKSSFARQNTGHNWWFGLVFYVYKDFNSLNYISFNSNCVFISLSCGHMVANVCFFLLMNIWWLWGIFGYIFYKDMYTPIQCLWSVTMYSYTPAELLILELWEKKYGKI